MENDFLKAYIHVEKFCNDAYGTKQGVTEYINYLEGATLAVTSKIPSWADTYKKLKEIRHKRNQYVHEGIEEFSKEDIEWLENFYQLLMEAKDPLALCRELLKGLQDESLHRDEHAEDKYDFANDIFIDEDEEEEEQPGNVVWQILTAILIAGIILGVVIKFLP